MKKLQLVHVCVPHCLVFGSHAQFYSRPGFVNHNEMNQDARDWLEEHDCSVSTTNLNTVSIVHFVYYNICRKIGVSLRNMDTGT